MTGEAGTALGDLARAVPAPVHPRLIGDPFVFVRGITHDSRAVAAGDLFCCVRGDHVDGHDFAPAAVASGAVALLVERPVPIATSQLLVDDVRAAMGWLAAAVHGRPSDAITVVGVTGTNGKTTTTHLVRAILEGGGRPCGVIGTLTGGHTTPEAPELQSRLARFHTDGYAAVAMEVSSHALALHRVDGTHFAVSVFTNLGRDHLDFHGTTEAYFQAKASLFAPERSGVAVINVGDAYGRRIAERAEIPTISYSLSEAEQLVVGPLASRFRWRGLDVELPLGGAFNVENALAALHTALVLGIDDTIAVWSLPSVRPVRGRFEPVVAGQPFAVLVDYAHTPDGLERALLAARGAAGGHRLIVVFGCGGDRDVTKRPIMGQVAAGLADVVVVTSDNPRSEDPAVIISDVLAGIPSTSTARIAVEPDRREAIALALAAASPGDVVLIAGKGHETTQTIGSSVLPFDDAAVAAHWLEAHR